MFLSLSAAHWNLITCPGGILLDRSIVKYQSQASLPDLVSFLLAEAYDAIYFTLFASPQLPKTSFALSLNSSLAKETDDNNQVWKIVNFKVSSQSS